MLRSIFATLALALLVAILGHPFSVALAQGSLTPPGAPAPTMKTLDQIEPRIPISTNTTPGNSNTLYNITQAGSYYLTGNITGVSNKYGIQISASGITLDLQGFELVGVPGSMDGINVALSPTYATNICIRNGTVRNWGQMGVNADYAQNSKFEDLKVSANKFYGLRAGLGGIFIHCSVRDTALFQLNGGDGLFAGTGSTVEGCTAYGNVGRGIIALDGSTVRGCASAFNQGDGIYAASFCAVSDCASYHNSTAGFYVFRGTVSGCTAYQNGTDGIAAVGPPGTVTSCLSYDNDRAGISLSNGGVIDRCSVYLNLTGILGGANSVVSGCSSSLNSSNGIVVGGNSTLTACSAYQNLSNGISAGDGSTITGCTAKTNTLDGILATFACTIKDCNASDNRNDGIQVTSGSFISQNNCYNNGPGTNNGAGLHITGNNNRVDSNNVGFGDRGIDVDGIDNLIIRNSVSVSGTNYSIVTGNKVGGIVNASTSGAISGSSGGAGVGTTDPWANFSY